MNNMKKTSIDEIRSRAKAFSHTEPKPITIKDSPETSKYDKIVIAQNKTRRVLKCVKLKSQERQLCALFVILILYFEYNISRYFSQGSPYEKDIN